MRAIVLTSLGILAFLLSGGEALRPDEPADAEANRRNAELLKQLAARVAAAEARCADIDWELEEQGELISDHPDGGLKYTATTRVVFQEGMRFRHRELREARQDGLFRSDYFAGFDGETNRSLTIYEFPTETVMSAEISKRPPRRIGPGPHTLWMRPVRWVPLSARLTPGAVRLEGAGARQDSIRHDGEEMIGGLKCVRLRGSMTVLGTRRDYEFVVWLATERSYLPVRYERHLVGDRERDYERFQVTKLRELAPGVWIPRVAERQTFERLMSVDGTQTTTRHEASYEVTKARLSPDCDMARFREIPIPPGTEVYVRDKNDQIIGHYIQGKEDAKESPRK